MHEIVHVVKKSKKTEMRKLLAGIAMTCCIGAAGIGLVNASTPSFTPQAGTIDERVARLEQAVRQLTLDTNHHLVVVDHTMQSTQQSTTRAPTRAVTRTVTAYVPTPSRTPWVAPQYTKPEDAATCDIKWKRLERPEFSSDDLYWWGTVTNTTNQKRRAYVEVEWVDDQGKRLVWGNIGRIAVGPNSTVKVGDWRSDEERLLDVQRIVDSGTIPPMDGWTYIENWKVHLLEKFRVSKCNGYV